MKWLHVAALLAALAEVAISRPGIPGDNQVEDDPLQNMNGLYTIANPSAKTSVQYSTDYSKRENISYVDVYSPVITTRYGEVYWTMMDPVKMPDDVVAKFKGKTMAIVGYEADQVRKTDQGDVSMPIFWQYNHHYIAHMTGSSSIMKEVDEETFREYQNEAGQYGAYNHERFWIPVDVLDDELGAPPPGVPTSQTFSEGNGGEYRKSYHGYPNGYAQLIYSPDTFHISPMQIDTHNRDHDDTKFVPGPLPKNAAAPPDAVYSGLLECPCTDRIVKKIETTYSTLQKGACQTMVMNSTECFAAATTLKVPSSAKQMVVNDSSLPTGCSVVESRVDNTTTVYYNSNPAGKACGGGTLFTGSGMAVANVSLSLMLNASAAGLATINLTGPDGVWFGVGFNAVAMEALPYAIIVNGTGGIMERKLANHDPGTQLADSVDVITNSVTNGVRTVVMTRPLKGATASHFTFDPYTMASLPFISAIGNTSGFAYHRFKGSATLSVTAEDGASCICNAGSKGSINGIGFSKNCRDEPYGDLIEQKNPTCWVQTYQGGLHCCHHGWILLDQDQNPWMNTTDEYYLKFRFWYQEYDPATKSHADLPRVYYQTEAYATEYDIPIKADSVPDDAAVHQITAHWQVHEMIRPAAGAQGVQLIYAGGHCHAPSCISMELYDADHGRLLCRQTPVYGEGNGKFDEEGYLALPPCLWGSEEEGLEPPILLPFDGNMTSIKRNNNTYAHYGDMASWQMRGVFVMDDDN